MKKLYTAILVILFSVFFITLRSSNILKASEPEEKYGHASITEIEHFKMNKRFKIDRGSGWNYFNPIPVIGRDKASAFAFNLPEETKENMQQIIDINVRYQYCLLNVELDHYGLASVCAQKSNEIEENISINDTFELGITSNYLTAPFRINLLKGFNIPKYNTIDSLITLDANLKERVPSYAKGLVSLVNDRTANKLKEYDYYVVMNKERTYSTVIIDISYIDKDGILNIDECIIDPETGACIVPEETKPTDYVVSGLGSAIEWIKANKENIIMGAMIVGALLLAGPLFIVVSSIFKLLIGIGKVIFKSVMYPFKTIHKIDKKRREKRQHKKMIAKQIDLERDG